MSARAEIVPCQVALNGLATLITDPPGLAAELSTNWKYLGLLESLGFTPTSGTAKVHVTGREVTASAPFDLRFSPVEAALNVLPVDRALTAIAKAAKEYKHARKLGIEKASVALKRLKDKVVHVLDKTVGDRLESYVAKALRKIPGISDKKADDVADALDDVLEQLADHYAEKLSEKIETASVKKVAKRLYHKIFAEVSLPVWHVKVKVSVDNNGTATYEDNSLRTIVNSSWQFRTDT